MNILVIPPHDWLTHPVPDRMYEIYERLALRHNVYVLRLKTIYKGKIARPTRCTMIEVSSISIQDIGIFHIINFPYHCRYLLKRIGNTKIDVIVGGSVTTNLIAGIIAKLKGIPYVFDCIEYYPRIAAAYYHKTIVKRLIGFVAQLATRINCMLADLVLCLSPNQKPYVLGLGAKRTIYIPNGVDIKMFNTSELKKGQEFVVGFVGTPEAWVDVNFIINFLKELKTSIDVKFILVGASLKTDLDSRLIDVLRKSNVKCEMTGFVPHERVPEYIAQMDLCLLPYELGEINYLSSLKLFEYLASGKPVLSKPYPDVVRIAKEVVLFYRDVEEAVTLTMDLIRQQTWKKSILAQSIARHYDWDSISRHVETVLEALINGHKLMNYQY